MFLQIGRKTKSEKYKSRNLTKISQTFFTIPAENGIGLSWFQMHRNRSTTTLLDFYTRISPTVTLFDGLFLGNYKR